jgi:hypothetical protein
MLIFRPELAVLVMSGAKTETRRLPSNNPRSPWWREHCTHGPGSRHAVCPGRGQSGIGFVVIKDVAFVQLGSITHNGAIAEGFADVQAFRRGWKQIHGSWEPRMQVWRLRFHVEEPVVVTPDALDGGFVAECPGAPGVMAQGETALEAIENLQAVVADIAYVLAHDQAADT